MKKLPALICIGLIKFYQLAISPLLGKSCRFYPSCSQYAKEAFTHHNLIRAFWLTIKRLSKCHPWHQGGYDPVFPQVKDPEEE